MKASLHPFDIVSSQSSPLIMRVGLLVVGIAIILAGWWTNFYAPTILLPKLWYMSLGGLAIFMAVLSSISASVRKAINAFGFLIFLGIHISILALTVINFFSPGFTGLLMISQLLFGLAFKRLRDFAIFGSLSLIIYTLSYSLCVQYIGAVDIEQNLFLGMMTFATFSSGLYVWNREARESADKKVNQILSRMVEQTGEAVVLLDRECEQILYQNQSAETYFAHHKEENRFTARTLLRKLDLRPVYFHDHFSQPGQTKSHQKTVLDNLERENEWAVQISSLGDNKVDYILMSIRDISPVVEHEKLLSENLSISDALLASLPDSLIKLDQKGIIRDLITPDQHPIQLEPDQFLDQAFSRFADAFLNPAEAAGLNAKLITVWEKLQPEELTVHVNQSSQDRYFSVNISPMKDQKHLLLVFRDITESKQFELALRQSEKNYREIFNSGSDGILILDVDTLHPVALNHACEKLLGYEIEELQQLSLPTLAVFPEKKELEKSLRTAVSGQSLSIECTLNRKQGPPKEVEMGTQSVVLGGKDRLMLIIRDLSERIEFTQHIGRFNDLFQSADIGMMILHVDEPGNDHSLRFVSANAFAESLLGNKQLVGKNLDEILPNWRLHRIPQKMLQVVTQKLAMVDDGVPFVDRKLEKQYWRTKIIPLPGQYVGMLFEVVTAQKVREIELTKSEQKFKELFQASPEAVLVVGSGGRILDANQIAARLFDLEINALREKSIEELLPNLQTNSGRKGFEALLTGDREFIESEVFNLDQQHIPAEIRGRTIELSGQAAILLHLTDIRERKQAEDRLRFFRSLINQANDAIFVLDSQSGKVVDFNERTPAALGYSPKEMRGLRLRDFSLTLEHKSLSSNNVASLISSGFQLYVGRHKRKDGSTYPVEVNMGYVDMQEHKYLVGVARDITERLYSEEALRQSEQKYRTLVEKMNEGLILTDNDETILFVNKRICEILGRPKEQIIGQRTYEVLQADGNTELIRTKSAMRRKGLSDQYELLIRQANGVHKWLLIAGAPYIDTNGDSIGTIAIITDITNRKQTELKLQEKNDELDAFVYKASHDLKGPLASIIGLTNIARDEVKDNAAHRYFDLIAKSTKRLDTILLELIDVTRINKAKLQLEHINVDELVDDIVNSLKHQSKSQQIRFQKHVALTNGFTTDKKLLNSILQNLIVNSINYQNPKAEPPIVDVWVEADPNQVHFKVSDNGLGIPEKMQKRVFEMFYRGNTKSKGSGLGLYIVKSAIEKLQGSCDIYSIEGQGTTFSFTLPMKMQLIEEND
ncbi:MAG: PAS domain S-box protein [Bacteroidota bacterium]